MSVASEITRISSNIASAFSGLEKKNAVVPQSRKSANLRSAIDSLPYLSAKRKAVNFRDYDGTVLYSYTADEFAQLTSADMPGLPCRAGMSCQGWNMSFSGIINRLSVYGGCDVGAVYVPDDGFTRLRISVPNEEQLSIALYLKLANGILAIDWGDGYYQSVYRETGDTYVNIDAAHTYPSAGDYVIRLIFSGSGGCILGQGFGLFGSVSTSSASAFPYANMLTAVELGESCTLGSGVFSNCYSLKTITLPRGITGIPESAFYACGALRFISLPDTLTSIGRSSFSSCSSINVLSIPESVTEILNTAFQYCRSLNTFALPSGVTVISSSAFSYCFSLLKAVIPASVASVAASSFTNSRNLSVLDMTAYSDPNSIPTLANANAFSNTELSRIIVRNETMKLAFQSAGNWSGFSQLFETPQS